MRTRTATGTLVLVVVVAPIVTFAVLTGTSSGTAGTVTEPPQDGGGILRPATTAADRPQLSGKRKAMAGTATVTLTLYSPQNGKKVRAGTDTIVWEVWADVDPSGNVGLALVSVDLVQDVTNFELIDILPGTRPANMIDFDRPNGISNPDPGGSGSAYGGTQIAGPSGGMDLVQIGGAQNTFGVSGGDIGQDLLVDSGVGQEQGGRLIATGSFLAPSIRDTYWFSLENGVANTLDLNPLPDFWPVSQATVDDVTNGSISFTVQ